MSNEQIQQADAGKSSSYPLVGREHFTEEERAAFLRQARLEEANYDPIKYMTESEISREHVFANPNHPVYLKDYIDIDTRHMQAMTEALANPSLSDLERGKTFIEQQQIFFEKQLSLAQVRLDNNQAALETYYQQNPHKRPDPKHAVSTQAESSVVPQDSVTSKQGQGWHKARVDASQPLQFSEAFRRTSELGRDSSVASKVTEFTPQVAPPDARALYTHHTETDTNIAWHQKSHNFSHRQPISDESLKRAGKLALVGMGLMAAVETAKATPGELPEKLSAAGQALKDVAVEAIPGVTYLDKMRAGKYQEAALDAASYLPLGDVTMMARTPEAQAVIDALPKNREALYAMTQDKTEAPISRHLAEYQMHVLDAKSNGEVMKGLTFSSKLSDLAEMKVVMQAQWAKNAEVFVEAVHDPKTNWDQLLKTHPEISAHAAAHLAAVQGGRPEAFITLMDANLSNSLAKGGVSILSTAGLEMNQARQAPEATLMK